MRQIVRHAHAPARVVEHPHAGGHDRNGDLHGRGVLMRHQAAGFLDRQVRPAPPRLIRVPHDEGAQDVGAARDFVGHDADARLQSVVETAKLVKRRDRGVARTIRVVHRRTVDGLAILPHGQLLGDGERLAVADDHADDVVIRRHPAGHERVDAHPRQADLAPRTGGVLERQRRQLLFVGAPPHFGGGRALFAEALDAPRVHELVHFLGAIGDLRVAFTAVNDLDAELAREVVELQGLRVVRDLLRLRARELPLGQRPVGDVQKALLGEVADQARVGAVLEHGRRPGLLPGGHHPAQVHVTPVERPLGRVLVPGPRVRVPELHRRVEIQDAVVVAPLNDLAAVDVPGEIDEEVAGRQMFGEERVQVLRRHLLLHEVHALFDPRLQRRVIGLELHDRDLRRLDVDVLHEDRQRAPGHEAKAHEQDPIRKRLHGQLSFFTSTLEFRPLCSYFSRRAGGRSSGVPSTKPALDWKYVNAWVESASSSRRPSSRARLSTY